MTGMYATPKDERRAACAALARMCAPEATDAESRRRGVKVLRPPPVRAADAPRLTAGAAELAREIRRGTYVPRTGAFLVDLKAHARGEA